MWEMCYYIDKILINSMQIMSLSYAHNLYEKDVKYIVYGIFHL